MPRGRRTFLSIAIGAAVLLAALQGLGIFSTTGLLSRGVAPLTVRSYALGSGASGWWQAMRHAAELRQENQAMRAQLERAQSQTAELQEARRQNAALAALVAFQERQPYPLVAARLVGAPSRGGVGVRTLDRGRREGVRPGQPVVAPQGSLVGVIQSADETSATVVLLDSPQSRIAVASLGRASAGGILTGVYQLGLTLTQLRPDDPIAVGDLVGTSGLQSDLPRGLVVGSVKEVWLKEGELFKRAFIETPIDLYLLVEVGILLVPPSP